MKGDCVSIFEDFQMGFEYFKSGSVSPSITPSTDISLKNQSVGAGLQSFARRFLSPD